MPITGIKAEMDRLTAGLKDLEKQAVQEVKVCALTVVKNMMARTPVWTGETVASYNAGIGGRSTARNSGSPPPSGQGPGTPLGSEVNRPSNEAKGMANVTSTINQLADIKRPVTISNGIDSSKWDLIDNGSAPTPERARNPGGVSKLAIQATRATLENWK